MSATAIYVSSDSGDHYLFCVEGRRTEKEVDVYLKAHMGEEYEFISTKMIKHSD